MIFAVIGILKQPIPPLGPSFEAAINDHLAPHFPRIVNAGYLRGPKGEPLGVMTLIDTETFAEAQEFLDTGPFAEAGYYDHVHLAAFDIEVGRLG
jgi:uncharacterized protein YciI